jgi:predicted GH43/DUF377 family glycosyl hydrolase
LSLYVESRAVYPYPTRLVCSHAHKEDTTMNQRFWNRFSEDWRANCLAWARHPDNPVLPPAGTGWKSRWTANPDLLFFGDRLLLYYRGNGVTSANPGACHDRIAAAQVQRLAPGELRISDLNGGDFALDVGREGEFDCHDALDPAAVVFKGRVWLYYSAIGSGPDSIGLAVSDDGERFEKVGKVMEGRAPEAIVCNDRLYLLCHKANPSGNYQLLLSVSDDGRHFTPVQTEPIFRGEVGAWDALSITTARLAQEDDWFYMLYGGSAYLADEPDFFGLARSRDLQRWERHPGNPIFGTGPAGAQDGGAIWFPALHETPEGFVMLYEGSPGKYRWSLYSAICMAWITG